MAHPSVTSPHAEHHPGASIYIRIAVILGLLTAAEVGVFYLELTSWLMVWMLLILALAKFFLVVAYFMHLKMDSRLFALMFFFPLTVMLSLAVVLMALFHTLTR